MKNKITEFSAKKYPSNVEWDFGDSTQSLESHTTDIHDGSGDKMCIGDEYTAIMLTLKKYQLKKGLAGEIKEELRVIKSNSYN